MTAWPRCLPRTIPLGHALWMLYTGERIDAQEAYRLGLVNRVVTLPETRYLEGSGQRLSRSDCLFNAPLRILDR